MVSPKINEQIEKEMGEVTSHRSSPLTVQENIGYMSSVLAQFEKDEKVLAAAGADVSKKPYFYGLFETLTAVNVDRVTSVGEVSPESKEFREEAEKIEDTGKMLRVVVNHIVKKSDDPKVVKIYRQILDGSGQVNALLDVLSYIQMIRFHPELAAEVNPGGVKVTPKLLDEVERQTTALLKKAGVAAGDGYARNVNVERQKQILTLCLDAITYIKDYAKIAFYNNMEYYKKNYLPRIRRSGGKSASDEQGDVSGEENEVSPEEMDEAGSLT